MNLTFKKSIFNNNFIVIFSELLPELTTFWISSLDRAIIQNFTK